MTKKGLYIIDYLTKNDGIGYYIDIRDSIGFHFDDEDDFDNSINTLTKKKWIYENELGDTLYRLTKETNKEIWADCFIFDYFQFVEEKQRCDKFEVTGLPNVFVTGTTKKCCSIFLSKSTRLMIPNINKMEEGVLYFYKPSDPNNLIEDIDL